jgi:hypothetical protein
MSDHSGKRLDSPMALHECVEANIQHAQNVCGEFLSIARNNTTLMESRAAAAQSRTRDACDRVFAFSEQYVTTSCDFAQQLMRAKTVPELMSIQTAFLQSLMRLVAQQANEFAGAVAKPAADAGPGKPPWHMDSSMKGDERPVKAAVF